MNKPHKHAAVIKAWADGAEIEIRRHQHGEWETIGLYPAFYDEFEFRIKPEKKMVKIKMVKGNKTSPLYTLTAQTFADEAHLDRLFKGWITVKDWFEVEVEDV